MPQYLIDEMSGIAEGVCYSLGQLGAPCDVDAWTAKINQLVRSYSILILNLNYLLSVLVYFTNCYLLIYLLIYLLTHLLIYLLTYLLTYYFIFKIGSCISLKYTLSLLYRICFQS